METDNESHFDPNLFTLNLRVKKEDDVSRVRGDVLATFQGFQDNLVPADRLDTVKKHLRYRFALSLDNSEAIASILARYVSLRRSPDTINKLFDLYAAVTPEDLREVARKCFSENNRTIVTLTGVKSK
jgi:zinc protease